MTSKCAGSRDLSLAGWRIYLEYERWRVNCPGCGGLHVETPGLAGEQLALHLAFCDACGQAVPDKAVAEMERLRLLVEGVNNKIRVLQRTRLRLSRRGISQAEDRGGISFRHYPEMPSSTHTKSA